MHNKDPSHVVNSDDYTSQDLDMLIFGPLDLEDDVHGDPIPFFQVKPFESDWSFYSQPRPVEEHNPDALLDFATDPILGVYSSSSPTNIPFPTDAISSFSGYQDTHLSPDQATFSPTPFSPTPLAALHPLPQSPFDGSYPVPSWSFYPDLGAQSSSSPTNIPFPTDTTSSYQDTHFSPDQAAFSPTSFATLHPHPLPRSPSFDGTYSVPSWASRLWDAPSAHRTQTPLTRPFVRHSPSTNTTLRGKAGERVSEQDDLPNTTIRKRKRKRKSKAMIQGKEITISGGHLTNVEGDYHEHINRYVIEKAPTYRRYLDAIPDMFKKIDAKLNNLFNFSRKGDYRKSDDSSGQTMHSSSRVENKNMGDTSAHIHDTEIPLNSLNDPPQPTSVFDDGYCIYQTPTPSRINDFTPNSRTFFGMAQDGRKLPSGNQHPYPFGYWVPGIVHYLPCWLPSWGGWISSWTSWISPPAWIWASFL